MIKSFLSLTLFLAFLGSTSAQYLASSELLYTWSTAQLISQSIFGAQNGVKMYKITYNTTDVQGEPTIATGALFIPVVSDCEFPMTVYNHGTIYLKDDVPSNNNGEALVGKFIGANGQVGVLPDYLGLGDSPGLHPYVHADTEASATIDMLRAVKEFCESEDIALNDQLFIAGYSQGGHAAMATAYEIETNLSDEFTLTASAPASGPYDISQTQAAPISSAEPYASPEYLPYVIFSYQLAYGTIYEEPSDFLISPYDTILPPLFDGMHSGAEIAAAMPAVPSEIIQPDELEAFNTDPNHPMRLALQDNDLYDWAPESPMRLYYCTEDAQVYHENSLFTYETMIANGATDVTLMDMGPLTHGGCALPALMDILSWFNELKDACGEVGIAEYNGFSVKLFPNPATSDLQIQLSDVVSGTLQIRDIAGRTVHQQAFQANVVKTDISMLNHGVYLVTIDGLPGYAERVMVY